MDNVRCDGCGQLLVDNGGRTVVRAYRRFTVKTKGSVVKGGGPLRGERQYRYCVLCVEAGAVQCRDFGEVKPEYYECRMCSKQVQEPNGEPSDARDAAGVHLCVRCYTVCGYENMVNDGHMAIDEVPEEYRGEVKRLVG